MTVPYWLDQPSAPVPLPPLEGSETADLAVIGGGFSGLWTALLAKERDPGRDVVLVEGRRIAWGGTGRNGGFCSASLTHGLANGLERFPSELPVLDRLGRENLDQIESAVARYEIDCDFARTGELTVATAQWQLEGLAENAALARELGTDVQLLDGPAVRAELHSPNYLGGLWDVACGATVDPARLAWGLRRACLAAGVRIYEHTPVLSIGSERACLRLSLRTPTGSVFAGRGGARSGRVRSVAAAAALLPCPGVRLRADDQAAFARCSWRALAGITGRGWAIAGNHVPLLPADRRQPDPVGRLRRRLLLRQQDRRPP